MIALRAAAYATVDPTFLITLGVVTILAVGVGSLGYGLCLGASKDMPTPTTSVDEHADEAMAMILTGTDELDDEHLAGMLADWSIGPDPWLNREGWPATDDDRALAGLPPEEGDSPYDTCPAGCDGGLLPVRPMVPGAAPHVTCPSCGGTGRAGAA